MLFYCQKNKAVAKVIFSNIFRVEYFHSPAKKQSSRIICLGVDTTRLLLLDNLLKIVFDVVFFIE
jgi:hypothetical protein